MLTLYRRCRMILMVFTMLLMCVNQVQSKSIPKKSAEDIEKYRKAAAKGEAWAQYHLGLWYGSGDGVTEKPAESAKWITKAAEHKIAVAQYTLGIYYIEGYGVRKNFAEAAKWWRKSADQGHATAQFNLGICYAFCRGVPKDRVEAYKWWLLAAGQGFDGAEKNITILEEELTREQIADGQRRARDFKPKESPEDDSLRHGNQSADFISAITGTGFFITESGFVITNNHVVKGASKILLASHQGRIAAKLVKVDRVNDLALLKVEGNFPALPVSTSRAVKLGASVATVGFPNKRKNVGGKKLIRRGSFESLRAAGREQGPHLGDGGEVVAGFQCSVFREEEEVPSDQ